jgi:hypothetical protein
MTLYTLDEGCYRIIRKIYPRFYISAAAVIVALPTPPTTFIFACPPPCRTVIDPYQKPLMCAGSSKWVYNGTVVAVVIGGEGKKKMTWQKCCQMCYENQYCYFWQRGSNREGQRCVMFSQTAARYEAKQVPCTCSRVSGKSPIMGGR